MAAKGNFHETIHRDEEVAGSSDRGFGLVFAGVFLVVGLWPLVGGQALRWWALAVAAACLGLALVRPETLAPLNRLWTRFGLLLHTVMNPLILGLLFFLVMTPIGMLRRLVRPDPLSLRADPAKASYWIARDEPAGDGGMENQF